MQRPIDETEAVREENLRLLRENAALKARLVKPAAVRWRDFAPSVKWLDAVFNWLGGAVLWVWKKLWLFAAAALILGVIGAVVFNIYGDAQPVDCYGIFHSGMAPWGQRWLQPHKPYRGYLTHLDERFASDAEAEEFLKAHNAKVCR